MKNIIGSEHIEELDLERKINLSLWRVLFVLVIVVIILSVSLLNLKDGINVTIKTPPVTKNDTAQHIIYNLNGANITYYELWGMYLVKTSSNINVDNVSDILNGVVNQMRPSKAIKKLKEIEKFKEDIIANKISQKFTPLESKIDLGTEAISSRATYTVLGISEQKVGSNAHPKKECKYEFIMEFNEGVFYVEDFGTDCF
jgi:hypothetical protein